MTEKLQDKELTDIKYLRARMTGNVGLALDHAYNLGFFDGEKNVADKIRAEIEDRPSCMLSTSSEFERGVNAMLGQVLMIIDKYRVGSEKI